MLALSAGPLTQKPYTLSACGLLQIQLVLMGTQFLSLNAVDVQPSYLFDNTSRLPLYAQQKNKNEVHFQQLCFQLTE